MREKLLTTYERADGLMIAGLYDYVTDPDQIVDLDEPTEIIEKQWVLTAERMLTVGPDA